MKNFNELVNTLENNMFKTYEFEHGTPDELDRGVEIKNDEIHFFYIGIMEALEIYGELGKMGWLRPAYGTTDHEFHLKLSLEDGKDAKIVITLD